MHKKRTRVKYEIAYLQLVIKKHNKFGEFSAYNKIKKPIRNLARIELNFHSVDSVNARSISIVDTNPYKHEHNPTWL